MKKEFYKNKISVCICTFQRPILLRKTLSGVISQILDPTVSHEIVVIDNDIYRTAEDVSRFFQQSSQIKIIYGCEPEKNIALTRNRAILSSTGNLIAFIDDDEYPANNWLLNMYNCLNDYKSDGVLGPVLPDFPPGAPLWLKKGGFCERKRHLTGTLITTRDMRTGNILLRREIFEEDDMWFDPARGRTGGEDGEFLGRQTKKGRKFVWCDEAPVFESVPEERWSGRFYMRKQYRIGTLAGEKVRTKRAVGTLIQDLIIFLLLFLILPFSFFAGKHIFMKVITKLAYNAGRILATIGISILKYR